MSTIQKTRIPHLLPRGPSFSPPKVGEEVGTELQPWSVWSQWPGSRTQLVIIWSQQAPSSPKPP